MTVFSVPQRATGDPNFVNIYFISFFFYTLYLFTKLQTILKLKNSNNNFEFKSTCALEWFWENKTIVNSNKYQAGLARKNLILKNKSIK